MRTIRVETSAATILLTEAPEPKVRDRQAGEIAKGAVGVVYIKDGESSLVKVTVPEGGDLVSVDLEGRKVALFGHRWPPVRCGCGWVSVCRGGGEGAACGGRCL
ncbi:hypothetical protein [Streptomyces sp. NPDC093094]|uniref:hypothetical protein n=1 Tax=Streptomyces sp. NPDC093094 TaxID=3366026 RepID=UPI00380FD002